MSGPTDAADARAQAAQDDLENFPAPIADVIDPYDLGLDGLQQLFEDLGQPKFRAKQVRTWLARGIDDPTQMTDLPAALRDVLAERFAKARPTLTAHTVADEGRTHKLLMAYPDGEAIETVVMIYPRRATVCVSTQAGCAMGCPFCATGQGGFRRQLTAGEVIRQVALADAALRAGHLGDENIPTGSPDRVTNVVFMGMGEPLANLPATFGALEWLHDPEGLGLGARHITVSTVGLVPGIDRLAENGIPFTLAISLHAANDELRDNLVPINRAHPIEDLVRAVERHQLATNRRASIEWCLIGDVNDGLRDARQLAAIAKRLRAHINIIPMNPTPGVQWKEPTKRRLKAFINEIERYGGNVTLRDTRGRDADAACGQLMANHALGAGRTLPAAVGAADRIDAARGLPVIIADPKP